MSDCTARLSEKDCTIVVNTCDAYSDVLLFFFEAFNEFWPDCEMPIVINTEHNSNDNYPALTHNCNYEPGSCKWGKRLRTTLQSIKTEYVLMLYDDFILEDFVDLNEVKGVFDVFDKDQRASVVYLINTSLPVLDSGINGFPLVLDRVDYRLNSAPGVWRREDLLRYTGENDNPWAWELFGSYRTYGTSKNFYTLGKYKKDIYAYNYKKGGAIYRGKWVREVVDSKLKKYRIRIDTSVRGYSEEGVFEPRSLKWKINFMLTGFKMVGFKSFLFVIRYIRIKINVRKT